MDAITAAVTAGRAGDPDAGRASLEQIWTELTAAGDALHRCTLAHSLADFYDDPAMSLIWDVRALDAADALTDQRAQQHHGSLQVAGFYPSLYLNLADDLRRLGSFVAAERFADQSREHLSALPEGPYGDTIRSALSEVTAAIGARSTQRRDSDPGAALRTR